MAQITANFSMEELIATSKKAPNIPNEQQAKNIIDLVENILQPARDLIGVPIVITSGFRSKQVNRLVGGAPTSQHCANNGAAADLVCPQKSNRLLFEIIRDNLPFDQLIWEFGTDSEPAWVHVSYNRNKGRKQVLKAYKSEKGSTKYEIF